MTFSLFDLVPVCSHFDRLIAWLLQETQARQTQAVDLPGCAIRYRMKG